MSDPAAIHEANRLQTVASYQALGLEPEEDFDRITALAARVFAVPVALVTLVGEDQQFFKSHHGTDLCSSPREVGVLPPRAGLAGGRHAGHPQRGVRPALRR